MKKLGFALVLALLVVGLVPLANAQEGNVFTFGEFGNAVQLDRRL